MDELTSMRKLKWTKKKKELQEAAAQKIQAASNWVRQNQEELKLIIPAIGVGVSGAARVAKSLSHKAAVDRDIKDRKTRFYDHSIGCYWHTKRPLRADELISVQRRKAAGESYGDIFESMKLLK